MRGSERPRTGSRLTSVPGGVDLFPVQDAPEKLAGARITGRKPHKHWPMSGTADTYCEMGIDVRQYAMANQDVKLASCVGCGMCAQVCPAGC